VSERKAFFNGSPIFQRLFSKSFSRLYYGSHSRTMPRLCLLRNYICTFKFALLPLRQCPLLINIEMNGQMTANKENVI